MPTCEEVHLWATRRKYASKESAGEVSGFKHLKNAQQHITQRKRACRCAKRFNAISRSCSQAQL
jgi:hypothetical protein